MNKTQILAILSALISKNHFIDFRGRHMGSDAKGKVDQIVDFKAGQCLSLSHKNTHPKKWQKSNFLPNL